MAFLAFWAFMDLKVLKTMIGFCCFGSYGSPGLFISSLKRKRSKLLSASTINICVFFSIFMYSLLYNTKASLRFVFVFVAKAKTKRRFCIVLLARKKASFQVNQNCG